MAQDRSFEELMIQLRSANEDAAREVFNRFAHRLIALARQRLGSRVRQKVDAEDVVQSAFRSFFSNACFDLDGWDNLWSLLVVITLRKCGRRVAYFRAACRDIQREQTLAQPAAEDAGWDTAAADPTPEEAAILAETVEQLLRGLKDWEQSIVTMTLQGLTVQEISAQIGRTERTVYRVLEQVKKHLQPGQTDPEDV
jgi:RNA polymerase sigma-70 factor (ECF subfamily)